MHQTLGRVSIHVAQAVARHIVQERPENLAARSKSSPTDLVTHLDAAGEALARDLIARQRPDDGFIGEEGGRHPSSSGITWIVDPIDGTTNFVYGLPMWAVSVAAIENGRSVAGCVCAPELGVTFHGFAGGGAWVQHGEQESRLRASGNRELADALIATGFGYAAQRRANQGRVVAHLIDRVRDIRRAGAASLDLCWVAAGQLDGYYEQGLHTWDFAAGALLVEEAGGVVTALDGTSLWKSDLIADARAAQVSDDEAADADTIIAGAPGIFDEFASLVRRSSRAARENPAL